jgi:probable H4MPT-linked C1 transfer pathway protein
MWKRWRELKDELRKIDEEFKPEKVGVVITAELADVFKSKDEGVLYVSKAVEDVFSSVYYMDVNGNLKGKIDNPRNFAASNWVASATFLLKSYDHFILADMGSTTTDLIPVTDRIVAAKTDYERLKRKELLYFGVLRTPVFYVLPEFDVPLVPEYFAITADAFVVTGDIQPLDYTCDTPDGSGKDKESCMLRLARTVCCDLEEVDYEYVRAIANAVKERMVKKVEKAMLELSETYGLERVIGCGIGEFVIESAARKAGLHYVSLIEKYGEMSRLFPAYAMARLVDEL